MQAVSLRSVRGPMPTAWKPCASSRFSSKSFQPPSGPMARSTRSSACCRTTSVNGVSRPGSATRRSPPVEEAVESVLDQRLELLVYRHLRQPRVAGLLQALDEQRAIAFRRHHVRVEVVAFHARRVGQYDLPDAERGELGPEAPHHLRPGQRKEHVNGRPWRDHRFEPARQVNRPVSERCDRCHAARAIEHPDAHDVPRRHLQHGHQVPGAHAGQVNGAIGADLAGVEENQVHWHTVASGFSRKVALSRSASGTCRGRRTNGLARRRGTCSRPR